MQSVLTNEKAKIYCKPAQKLTFIYVLPLTQVLTAKNHYDLPANWFTISVKTSSNLCTVEAVFLEMTKWLFLKKLKTKTFSQC